uniref:Expressed conserved protein n=1 Tax=Echinococcus granulosus TaxID=6210 RepID=A0A068X2V0_ECHGR|nr:hypothetical protein EgrG_002062600 [Echinococcus granulosus]
MMSEIKLVCVTFFCAYLGFALLNYCYVVNLATTGVPPAPTLSPSLTSEYADQTSHAVPPLPDEEVVAITSEIQRLSTPTMLDRMIVAARTVPEPSTAANRSDSEIHPQIRRQIAFVTFKTAEMTSIDR